MAMICENGCRECSGCMNCFETPGEAERSKARCLQDYLRAHASDWYEPVEEWDAEG